MSYNSTHTALICLTGIIIAGMQYGVNLADLAVVVAPIGAYVALREKARISENREV